MAPSRVHIRNYAEGDLPDIIGLYDSIASDGPSFTRDERSLRHLIRSPGTSEDSIFVAMENEKIIGLAMVSVTNEGDLRQGNIFELQANNVLCLDALVQAALNYCAAKDVDMMAVVSPTHLDTGKVFTDWLRFERNVMMCKPLSIVPLLQALVDNKKIKSLYAGKEFLFVIDNEMIQIRVTPEAVETIQLNTACDKSSIISVTMSSKTFLQIVFGMANAYMAYLTRRVRIKSLKDIPLALKLLRLMRLDRAWSIALVDSM